MSSVARDSAARRVAPLASGIGAVAAAGYLAANDPMTSGWFLPCPFRAATGLACPGCGVTRAAHHLLRGDVFEAVRLNVFAPVIAVVLVLAWAAWLGRDTFGRSVWRPQLTDATTPVVLAGLAFYGVVRNLA